MVDVSEVAENIYMIDNRLFSIPKWGSVYFLNETKKALVECGPTTSVPYVLEGIRKLGVRPEEIDYLIVTHVHLDHAGGAGILLESMPDAKVIVHHKGARHLVDPARLVEGAIEARGQDVLAIHGAVMPVVSDRVISVCDGEIISLSGQQSLSFLDTPGHAPHHICIHESRNRGVFAGDVLGQYIAQCDILLPFNPPPQFDLELCLVTFERLNNLSAKIVYYSHFGTNEKVSEQIDLARKKLMIWDGIARQAAGEGTFRDLKAKLIAQAYRDLEPMKGVVALAPLYNYLVNKSIPISAEGHTAYYRKFLNLLQ